MTSKSTLQNLQRKQEDNQTVHLFHQSTIKMTMKKLAESSMLPRSEIIHFGGNPLRYYIFMKHFENQVEKDIDDNGRRLQLLIQYCSGKAKKVVESCILLSEEEGYYVAQRLLEESFGSKYPVLGFAKYLMAHRFNLVIERHLWI